MVKKHIGTASQASSEGKTVRNAEAGQKAKVGEIQIIALTCSVQPAFRWCQRPYKPLSMTLRDSGMLKKAYSGRSSNQWLESWDVGRETAETDPLSLGYFSLTNTRQEAGRGQLEWVLRLSGLDRVGGAEGGRTPASLETCDRPKDSIKVVT